jgi:hypothetical protein
MSATLLLPAARAAATTCSFVRPAGSCLPIAPANIRSVARPRIFGPMTMKATLATPSASTAMSLVRSGLSRPIRRRTEGRKVIGFSAGIPAPPQGPP